MTVADLAGGRGGDGVLNDSKESFKLLKLIEFFGVNSDLSDALVPREVELGVAGCIDIADMGDSWKSAKSSSSKDARFDCETRVEKDPGGGGRANGDRVDALLGWAGGPRIAALAAFAAARVRGDFAMGEGTGGETWSTGD